MIFVMPKLTDELDSGGYSVKLTFLSIFCRFLGDGDTGKKEDSNGGPGSRNHLLPW